MRRLIYVSTARHALKPEHMRDILSTSRENNRRDGLTGLLISHEGQFFQVLEGERDAVEACFDRIRRDWRHGDCRILFDEVAIDRDFEHWSMACRMGSDLNAAQLRQLQDIRRVIATCDEGGYAESPALNVFLRAFLSNFRLLDAA